jgi:hypothetical protein
VSRSGSRPENAPYRHRPAKINTTYPLSSTFHASPIPSLLSGHTYLGNQHSHFLYLNRIPEVISAWRLVVANPLLLSRL